MSFPDSYSLFDRIDVSSSIDMVEKLDDIMTAINTNAGNVLLIKNSQSEMKECLDSLCSKENMAISNDAGWRVII